MIIQNLFFLEMFNDEKARFGINKQFVIRNKNNNSKYEIKLLKILNGTLEKKLFFYQD